MNHWEKSPFTVTPVAALLARCVARGTISQEELVTAVTAVSRDSSVSDSLQETEQHFKMKRRRDELQMELDMLRLEKDTADVSHKFYLSQRLEVVQRFSSHLQVVLKEQSSLRQRLMRPMHQTNLPIQADLHRYVVELIRMVVDFIEKLDRNLEIVRSVPTVDQSMVQLNTAVVQLLDQVSEVESLSKQVLQWKEHHSSMLDQVSEVESLSKQVLQWKEHHSSMLSLSNASTM